VSLPLKYRRGFPNLDDAPAIHDSHPVGDRADYREIMRNQ
jgi:hypothetical protein